ncbi:hypothetical protein D081_1991 [Anaerovibrio sp. JC8]|uniref:hypothetical protein n=1 Tax=Anaerovibrio sp. JC8 TaxID=1240085 RepID=UPI000A0DC589|nr:hypothetical protein [Anaerovibrio sp. JC8]ORT99262.1 hypothetical protein D081_1991 [Anaerovibrio sp. JC8]
MGKPPEIANSTALEREQYIRDNFYCRGNCDICGMCKVYHGKSPETVYADYIAGKRSFQEITEEYR